MDNVSQWKVIRAGFRIIRKEDTPRPRIMIRDKANPAWSVFRNCTSVQERDRIWENLISCDHIIVD